MFDKGEIFDEILFVIPLTLLTNFLLPRPYDNLGIPGAQLFDVDSNADLIAQFILRDMGTQLEQAIELDPDLISLWIGSNDVLGAAVHGGDLERITPQADFRDEYEDILQELTDNTTAMIVVANVANVTDIPFINHLDSIFTTVPSLGILTPVPVVFNESFEPVDIGGGTFIPLLTDETDVAHLLLPAAELYRESGIGIPDEADLVDLGFDPITAGVIVDGLEDAGLQASGIPFGGGFTLTNSEDDSIQDAVDGFNNTIEELAAEFSISVVDINQELSILSNMGIDGYTGQFVLSDVENTAFSLDGIHPNNGGHAIIANSFIDVINKVFGSNFPPLDIDLFRGQYVN